MYTESSTLYIYIYKNGEKFMKNNESVLAEKYLEDCSEQTKFDSLEKKLFMKMAMAKNNKKLKEYILLTALSDLKNTINSLSNEK